MTAETFIRQHRDTIVSIAEKYGASNIRVFGSVATDLATPDSDLDLLVDLAPDRSLIDLSGLLYELEQALGMSVDVVTADSLHWLSIAPRRSVIARAVFARSNPLRWVGDCFVAEKRSSQ